MRYLYLIPALLPLLAEAGPSRIAPPVERVENSPSYFVQPAIGEIATAEVGESLYRAGTRTVTKRFTATLKADAESKMDRGYLLSIRAGIGGKMMMRGSFRTPMLCFQTKNTGVVGFFGDRNVEGCLVDTKGTQVFDRATFPDYDRLFELSAPVPYEVSESDEVTEVEGDFKFQFLYQGLSKGEVKIAYREFINGLARPAFDQDVSYELDVDGTGTIGFKGMRIKVLKATGHNIRYILEQPMPPRTDPVVEQPAQKPWYQGGMR